ncbi:hypothetical protein LNTAR_17103 [Lentisphaera araneosa HTCC2155]|uniref:Uncharacterized protein n=1 Tax=Lentisphaera araneosa HTCC2155 TaxID=313628 RepID=A6DFA9_9BACT|nr:hypothetical protein [Lentisphaera araneosa]EDM29489.1 hypothetical protein LNTAR_17103 [Lentisphaera araneosa HTCC2155]
MGEQKSDKEVLDSLVYLLTTGKVSKEKLIPAFKSLSEEVLDLEDVLATLKETPGSAFQEICQQLEDNRLEDAKKFYELNQISSVDKAYFAKQFKGLPLEIAKNNQEHGIYSELDDACVLLKDYFSLLKKQHEVPILFAHVENKSLNRINFFTENKHFLSALNIENLVAYSWHQASDDLRVELRQLKQESQESYVKSFDDALSALNAKEDTFTCSSPKVFLDALTVYLGEGGELFDGLLDIIFQWPSSDVLSVLKVLWQKAEDKSKFSLLLTMKFGDLASYRLKDWAVLSDKFEGEYLSFVERVNYLSKKHPIRLLYMWCMDHGEADDKLLDLLKESCLEEAEKNNFQELIERYRAELLIPQKEQNSLLGIEGEVSIEEEQSIESEAAGKIAEVAKSNEAGQPAEKVSKDKIILKDYLAQRDEKAGIAQPSNEEREKLSHEKAQVTSKREVFEKDPLKAAPKEVEKKSSVWQEHMKPFINENWFMIAGLMLFIAGSLILSYFTWDKHWLFRYSLMPSLLASFTIGLAYLGKWIESKGKEFTSSATILRGAAIQLLPINFMAVALMSADTAVSYKHFLIPVMAALYLSLTWLGLKRWCMAVSPQLNPLLPRTLLVINSLVMLAPITQIIGLESKHTLLMILGTGFYLGFALLSYSFHSFSLRVQQMKSQVDRRVIWFFTLMIAASFVQVFLWVHSHLRSISEFYTYPEIYTYAPLLVVAGGLILMLERRSGELITRLKSEQEDESFVGYALIVVALVMSFPNSTSRIICLFIASYVWFLQSLHRQRHVHYYITISLLSIAFFSIGGLEGFNQVYLPSLGVLTSYS